MQFGSLRTELIYNIIKSEILAINDGDITSACFSKSLEMIMKEYPQLSEVQALSLIELVGNAVIEQQKEKVSLVATIPPSFSLKTKRIQNVTEELIKDARKSVLLTGYSISGFMSEMIDLLMEKSQKGVLVKIFFNDIKSQTSLEKIFRYRSKFLEIYDYTNDEDKMAALHAKMLVIDSEKMIISSANLSYHGMSGNIEIGTLIQSAKIGREIEDLFKNLVFQKIFKSIDNYYK